MENDHGGELQPGDIVADRFRITARLGTGAFATTYSAHDLESNQLVAVKALSLAHVDNWKTVELFRREAAALRSLSHSQIPAYIDFVDVEADRSGFLVQALAPGQSLAAMLDDGRRFAQEECLDIAKQVLGVLHYLSTLNPPMVHRDIKPANLILGPKGRIALVDFGGVRELAENTVSGSTMVGTLTYMAPEQLRGQATCASDIFALGMTLVHLLTGIDPASLPKRRLKPDFADHVDIEPAFEFLISQMLEVVPEDRIESAEQGLSLLSETSIIASPSGAGSGDEVDALVRRRDEILAENERERQRELTEQRLEIARRRRGLDGSTRIIDAENGLTLEFHPSLRARLRVDRLVGIVAGTTVFLAASVTIALGIIQAWHLAVLINVGIWFSFFGIAGLAWTIAAVLAIRRERVSVRVTPQRNFIVFRNPRRPMSIGRVDELDVRVWAGNQDQEYSTARIDGPGCKVSLDRLTDKDVAVFEQFRKVAKLGE